MDETLLAPAEEPGLWLPEEPKLSIRRRDGFALVTYGRSAWVHRVRLGERRVEGVLAEVETMLREQGLDEATWWLGELSTPAGLADRLGELGLKPDDPAELTSLTIDQRPAGAASVEVRRVETLEQALEALEIDWSVFAVPPAEREVRRREALEAWPLLQAAGTQTTYLAYLEGEPVGFGRAVFTPDAALLLGGATLPGARGHGVYTSIVHARWDEAVERGIPRIVVSAGPMSAPILERLGFAPIGRVRLLRQRM